MTHTVAYIGLGSNLGDPAAHVSRAFEELDALAGCRLTARSPLFRSAPMGPVDQDWFVNAVAEVRVAAEPRALLDALLAIERDHGRDRRGDRWGPRTLDLDLLLYGDRVIDEPGLTVPHPGLTRRNFVVYPLLLIAPELVLPDGRPLEQVAAGLHWEGLEKMDDTGPAAGGQGL